MRTKTYKLGHDMGHDIQITATLEYTYAKREHEGKHYPARREVHLLADVRLSDGAYPYGEESELLERARVVYDAMRAAYQCYPDGNVKVSMVVIDDMVNC